jgi:hypothetical protein
LAATLPSPNLVQIDLSSPFKTRAAWRFISSQDPATVDPRRIGVPDNVEADAIPGLVHLCLRAGPNAPCDPKVVTMPRPPAPFPQSAWDAHYLNRAEIVYPLGLTAPPLLLLQTASEHSVDNDQVIFTQLLKYDPARDHFEQIYSHVTGRNNNEEDRFMAAGPLRGSVISVEPTLDAPFAYWITVSKLTPEWTYRRILHYRSATLYGDGNELGVVDSEMPNIEQHLGLWRPGKSLPLPSDGQCPRPRLLHRALWCK